MLAEAGQAQEKWILKEEVERNSKYIQFLFVERKREYKGLALSLYECFVNQNSLNLFCLQRLRNKTPKLTKTDLE